MTNKFILKCDMLLTETQWYTNGDIKESNIWHSIQQVVYAYEPTVKDWFYKVI